MDKIRQIYENNYSEYRQLVKKISGRLFSLSLLRLIVFITGVALLIILWKVSQIAAVASMISALILFAFLLRKYSANEFKKSFCENMMLINENEVRGLDGDQSCFDGGDEYKDPNHDFSHDIDLFGADSLYQYLNRTCTGKGKRRLASWLGKPDDLADEMSVRQDAVKELSGMTGWRQEFNAYGMLGIAEEDSIDDFNEWLGQEPYYRNSVYKILRFIIPLITLVLLLMSATGVIHYSFFIFVFLLNLCLISVNLRRINKVHSGVSKKHRMLKNLGHLINHFEKQEFGSSYIKHLQENFSEENEPASVSVGRLSKIIQAFDSRLNMLMAVPLNGLFLWDIQCVIGLEKWKSTASRMFPQWFENLGCLDALCSLANFAANNKSFCYPVASDGTVFLDALDMGHPLIASGNRVDNDFKVSQAGEINIITGANMAGKSTFLRTVAVNLVLAMAGAPVCATRFTYTPCTVFTSMRTTDSLSDKESYFYAELKRLRLLKERLENKENIFFLLDEILKGTNSKDKSEGSLMFIEKIQAYSATGIIATHDILLGNLGDRYDNIINRCFEIEIEGDEVKFDYKLRDGLTSKMNAGILMKQMGII